MLFISISNGKRVSSKIIPVITQVKKVANNLFVTSKNEFSNAPIHELKVLQNVFEIKKQGLKHFLK